MERGTGRDRVDVVRFIFIPYKRMEEKDVILDRTTLLSLIIFPTEEWRRRMSYRTGPCSLCSYFLQKNGGNGCHPGLDLTILNLISYKRMEEKDVIADTTLSIILSLS